MTWIAPAVDRPDEPELGEERPMLEAWLEYHRATLLLKCAGLTEEQLPLRSVEPSSMSLLGLVRHLTGVERSWFRRRFGGLDVAPIYYSAERPDDDFDDVLSVPASEVWARFAAEVEQCRAVVSGRSLDDTFVHERTGRTMSLRYVYTHMIEEYARHNGHADLLRERIDGATGE